MSIFDRLYAGKGFITVAAVAVMLATGCPAKPQPTPPVFPMAPSMVAPQVQAQTPPATLPPTVSPVIDRGAWTNYISRYSEMGVVVSFQAVITSPETMARVVWQTASQLDPRKRIVGVDKTGQPVVTVWSSMTGTTRGGDDVAMRAQLEQVSKWVIM